VPTGGQLFLQAAVERITQRAAASATAFDCHRVQFNCLQLSRSVTPCCQFTQTQENLRKFCGFLFLFRGALKDGLGLLSLFCQPRARRTGSCHRIFLTGPHKIHGMSMKLPKWFYCAT